jgi:hypothetical protein
LIPPGKPQINPVFFINVLAALSVIPTIIMLVGLVFQFAGLFGASFSLLQSPFWTGLGLTMAALMWREWENVIGYEPHAPYAQTYDGWSFFRGLLWLAVAIGSFILASRAS